MSVGQSSMSVINSTQVGDLPGGSSAAPVAGRMSVSGELYHRPSVAAPCQRRLSPCHTRCCNIADGILAFNFVPVHDMLCMVYGVRCGMAQGREHDQAGPELAPNERGRWRSRPHPSSRPSQMYCKEENRPMGLLASAWTTRKSISHMEL